MKIKGSVELRVIHAPTGKVKQVVKQDNLVPNATLLAVLGWNSNPVFGSARISISTSQEVPNILNNTVRNIIATGFVPTGVTSPTWNDGVDPPFLQIQNRIDFIGTTRTFWTIALTSLNSNNNQANLTSAALAYLLMDTSCTQGPEDYIDIYYRIQFAYIDGQNLTRQARYDFGEAQANRQFWNIANLYTFFGIPKSLLGYNNLYARISTEIASWGSTSGAIGWATGLTVASHFKRKYNLTKDLQDYVGVIFNTMLQGQSRSNECAYAVSLFTNPKEPFQNGFWHSAGAPGPFYDPLTPGNSQGEIELSGEWNQLTPEIYRINIVTGGQVGVATYNWSVRKHLGFNGNTYNDITPTCIYRNPNIAANEQHHGWKDEDNDVLAFSQTQIVQYDLTGVTLLDVVTGEFQSWDIGSNIRQCATDGVVIYAGCRSTGLWVINTTTGTVTHPVLVPCYGVDVGREGIAYGVFSNRLSSSSNWQVSIPINFTGLTNANWSRTKFIKVDPENLEDRIAIVADNGAGVNRVIWYSVALSTATLGFSGTEIKSYPASLDVSDSGGLWAIRQKVLTWNAAATIGLSSVVNSRNFNHSLYGSDAYFKVTFADNNLVLSDRTVDAAGVTQNTYTSVGTTSFITHLGGGIILTDRFMRQLYTRNDACWIDYGWNGTAWVEGETRGRPTHAVNRVLQNGIVVKFANATSGTSFTATNFFTQSVNYGLLKDNATRFNWVAQWYSKPAQFNSVAEGVIPDVEPYAVRLPASIDPDFVRIETDTLELHNFTIDGEPVLNIYIAGEPPGILEVSMSASGNGILIFNAADAGKTFRADPYAWVKN